MPHKLLTVLILEFFLFLFLWSLTAGPDSQNWRARLTPAGNAPDGANSGSFAGLRGRGRGGIRGNIRGGRGGGRGRGGLRDGSAPLFQGKFGFCQWFKDNTFAGLVS